MLDESGGATSCVFALRVMLDLTDHLDSNPARHDPAEVLTFIIIQGIPDHALFQPCQPGIGVLWKLPRIDDMPPG